MTDTTVDYADTDDRNMDLAARLANLRAMVRGTYDLQKLRIQMGLRIVANFKSKLGIQSGQLEDKELTPEAKKLLTDLRSEYKRLADAMIQQKKEFSWSMGSIISNRTEYTLIESYLEISRQEDKHFRVIERLLSDIPVWKVFLNDVRGIGPAMGGVIVTEFDIHKSKYVTSMWKYAGLDVVGSWHMVNHEWATLVAGRRPPKIKLDADIADLPPEGGPDDNGYVWSHGVVVEGQTAEVYVHSEDKDWSLRINYVWISKGRSRRREHLVERTYTNRKGEEATCMSVTFNTFLKTKLIGVLGPSFLRANNAKYRKIYDDYKHRLENRADTKEWTVAHRHNAAIRYMVKQFLRDLYIAWRTAEGLEVFAPYEEAKLGMRPHTGTAG